MKGQSEPLAPFVKGAGRSRRGILRSTTHTILQSITNTQSNQIQGNLMHHLYLKRKFVIPQCF